MVIIYLFVLFVNTYGWKRVSVFGNENLDISSRNIFLRI